MTCNDDNDDEITRDDRADVRTRRECRLWLCPRKERPMTAKKKAIELFVDGTRIVNQDHQEITIETARRLWNAGKVTNCNMSFQRLATRANWDFAELARQYAEMDKAR